MKKEINHLLMASFTIILLANILTPFAGYGNTLNVISFEEAVRSWSEEKVYRWWNLSSYDYIKEYESEPLITTDGLTEGRFAWRASNGSLYEVVYPSGEVRDEIERLKTPDDSETYYVWILRLMDHSEVYIDARNGDVLLVDGSRAPGVMFFDVAARVARASQPKMELWNVQKYERTASYQLSDYSMPDGSAVGHFLYKAADGSFYEADFPIGPSQIYSTKALNIQISNDAESYYVWEIITQNKTYYICPGRGAILLVTGITEAPLISQLHTQILVIAASVAIICVAAFTLKKRSIKRKENLSPGSV